MRQGTMHPPARHAGSRRGLVALALAIAVSPWAHTAWADAPSAASLGDVATSPADTPGNVVEEGLVSWYGAAFDDRVTASGERFDPDAYTMAHPSLPFGTRVRVTNLRNGRSVVVRVNDRGPNVGRRIADLSQAAASVIGMLRRGIARVRLEVLGDEAVARN